MEEEEMDEEVEEEDDNSWGHCRSRLSWWGWDTLYFEQCSQVSLLIIINVHILSSLFVVVVVISAVAVVVVERLVTVLVGWWPETDWSTPVSSIIITHTTSPHNTVNNHPPPTIHTIMISSEINSTRLMPDLYIIKYCQLVASIVICRECWRNRLQLFQLMIVLIID